MDVAERAFDFEYSQPPGAKGTIRAVVRQPVKNPTGEWEAGYAIHGPDAGETWEAAAFGVDSMQALALALHALPEMLHRYDKRGRITFGGVAKTTFGTPGDEA